MRENLVCWKCGASLKALTLPLRRLEQCPECEAELHVCRMCESFNPRLHSDCDEPMAEDVREKERANFCDYFKPRANAYIPKDDAKVVEAKSRLYDLFGMSDEQDKSAGKRDEIVSAKTDEARKRLEALFEDLDKKPNGQNENP